MKSISLLLAVLLPIVLGNVNTFIDEFVEQWKLDNPDLSSLEVSQLHEKAEVLKQHLDETPIASNTTFGSIPYATNTPSHVNQSSSFHVSADGSLELDSSTVSDAFQLIHQAQQEASIRNKQRLANPKVNDYSHFDGKPVKRTRAVDHDSLQINETISTASAIVANVTASNATVPNRSQYSLPQEVVELFKQTQGTTSTPLEKRAKTSWWMEDIVRQGIVPYGGKSNDGYKVFRNVKSYGAVGDGKADDTDAIQRAISDGNRCGANCGSSTTKPAVVYFPAGTYRVRLSINIFYNTQIIGNVNDLPIILASDDFVGLGVLSSDVYTGGNGGSEEWYINQNNFLRQVRNLLIDTSKAKMENIAGLHWQVAQATSIHNVHFQGPGKGVRGHVGIFAENGSGGFMSNLYFTGLDVGIRCGNQQFTTHALAFYEVSTAVDLLWDWGWTWKHLLILQTDIGFKIGGDYRGGSMLLLDSRLINVPLGILVTTPKGSTEPEKFSITLELIHLINVATMVLHGSAGTVLPSTGLIGSWVLGRLYDADNKDGYYSKGDFRGDVYGRKDSVLTDEYSHYYIRSRPQYENVDASFFINAHEANAAGDGVSDDTFALALAIAVSAKLRRGLWIPMGSYVIKKTILIPPGAVIVGECWAQLVATGAFFQDIEETRAMVMVGKPGDKGSVEIQDLLFTVQGQTAGAVLVEWNIAADKQGAAAMWDTHFRIGGAAGSQLQAQDCPKLTGSVHDSCIAGALMLHIMAESDGYFENIWAWTADHDIDSGLSQTQIDVYVARGILIESVEGPVWLYGTSSEHAVLYQYLLYGASNVLMSMIQTESPYYLPDPQAPAPFKNAGKFFGDPQFDHCDSSNPHCAAAWGLSIVGSTRVHVYGAGLYNWFQRYTQQCVDTQDCQQRVVNIQKSASIWLYNVYTIGTVEMITSDLAKPALSKSNTNTNQHPFTSIINGWLVTTNGSGSVWTPPDNDDDELAGVSPIAICNRSFSTIQDVHAAADQIQDECVSKYIASVLERNLTDTLATYDTIIHDDYQSKFKIFHGIIDLQMQKAIQSYMVYNRAEAWSCGTPVDKVCCDGHPCSNNGSGNIGNADCFHLGCQDHDPATKCLAKHDDPTPCPDRVTPYPTSLDWFLDDPDKFYKKLSDEYGVPKDWVELVDLDVNYVYGCAWGQVDETGTDLAKCQAKEDSIWHNYPQLKKGYKLSDPSDTIKGGYGNAKDLIAESRDQMELAELGLESWGEIAHTLLLPTLTMSNAVEKMQGIVKIADEKIEAERKAAIADWITAILFFIPLAGEAAEAVGAAVLRTLLNLAGDLADVGYSVYSTVSDKDNILANILGMIPGIKSAKSSFKEVALEVRNLQPGQVNKLPKAMKDEVVKVRKLQGFCKRK